MGSGWEPSPGAKQPEHEADFSHHLMFKFHEVFLNPAPPPIRFHDIIFKYRVNFTSTDSMQQGPCSEAKSDSASQAIPATGPYPEADTSSPQLPTLFL